MATVFILRLVLVFYHLLSCSLWYDQKYYIWNSPRENSYLKEFVQEPFSHMGSHRNNRFDIVAWFCQWLIGLVLPFGLSISTSITITVTCMFYWIMALGRFCLVFVIDALTIFRLFVFLVLYYGLGALVFRLVCVWFCLLSLCNFGPSLDFNIIDFL